MMIYRLYLKCLDKHQKSVPHTKSRTEVHTNVCLQTLRFQSTVPTIAWPQSFRFLSVGTLKKHNVFNSSWKWRYTSPHISDACQTIHNHPLKGCDRCSCIHWFRWRPFWSYVVNCDLINNKNSTLIKQWTYTVNVLSLASKILHI